jgi:Flp pilus assembly protein TadG
MANRGAAVVELALLMPLLILIILGMIEMGWLVMKQSEITNAARAGARYAALPSVTDPGQVTSDPTSPALIVLAKNQLSPPLSEVTVGPPGTNPLPGRLVTVNVTLKYRNGVELMNWPFVPDQLHASVSMAKEGPAS